MYIDTRNSITKYWNHSKTPNCTNVNPETGESDQGFLFASKDIEIGEELFDNYA